MRETKRYGDVLKPVPADCVDRLAAEVGSPPNIARAQALEQRLPITVNIDGQVVHYGKARRDRDGYKANGGWLLARSTADGHRISFRIDDAAWPQRPRYIGWLTPALRLPLTALAYHWVRRLFRPIVDIRAGAQRFGAGNFRTPFPCAAMTSWASWRHRSTEWRPICKACSTPRVRSSWPLATNCVHRSHVHG